MSQPIGIAMLGTKHAHAAGKMQVLRASEDWRVIGVCEPDKQARAASEQLEVFSDLQWLSVEELLNNPEVQVVAVEGEVSENLPRAEEVVRAGKHLHLEKPAGTDLASFAELLRLVDKKGVLVQLGYMFRYNPAFRFVFEAAEAGQLGEVFFVRGRMSTSIGADQRRALALYSGGMMFELGCHLLDAVVRLLGPPRGAQGYLRHDTSNDDGLADNTLAVFSYDKAMAVVETAAMEVDPLPRRRFEVYGTEGSVIIEPLEPPRVSACFQSPPQRHPSGWHEVEMPPYERYVDDFRELAACVINGRALSYSGDHDIAVHTALLQACGIEA